jgi:hypothetical protein
MIFTLNSDSSICSLSSLDQLGSFKLQASNVQRIDTTQQYKEVLSSLIVSSDGNYYIINNGSKILLSIPAMTNWGIKNVNPCSFTTNFLTRFKTQIKSALFARLPNGSIFYAKDGAGHQVLTYNTFLELGGNTQNTIDVPYDFLTYIANSSSPIQ